MKTPAEKPKDHWPLWALLVAIPVGSFLWGGMPVFMNSLSWRIQWHNFGTTVAGWFFLLLILRYIVGKIRKEPGPGWIWYSILIATSFIWFMLIWNLVGQIAIEDTFP